MKKIKLLMIAIFFNAIGTGLMSFSDLGLSIAGAFAANFANFANISLGLSFNVLSLFFYFIAVLIYRKFNIKEFIYSFSFSLLFGLIMDNFLMLLNGVTITSLYIKMIINVIGFLILFYGVAVHLYINTAVHPLDVFLKAVQEKFTIKSGTYITYSIFFICSLVFGFLDGQIFGISIGTINTLIFSGVTIGYFTTHISKYHEI